MSSLCTVGCGTETATEKKVNKTQSKDKKKIKVVFKCVADDLSVNNKNQMTMMYNQVKKVTSVNIEGNKQKITKTILQDTSIANNGKAMMSWE